MANTIALNPWSVEGLILRGELTVPEMIEWAAKTGFDAIDLGESWMGLSPNPDPARLRDIRSRTRDLGLSVSSCWFWSDLLAATTILGSPDRAMDHVRRYLAIAEAVGATYVTLQNGVVPPGITTAQARAVLLDLYAQIAPAAADHGVVVGFEAARPTSEFNSPQGALDLVREFDSELITVTPDFESWRRPRPGMPPLSYPENPGRQLDEPLDVSVFVDCLAHAPLIHAKFLEFDEDGEDPNIPAIALLDALRADDNDHVICVEYEGWIPDLFPDREPRRETGKALDLIRRRLS
jgi:hypothetical protein